MFGILMKEFKERGSSIVLLSSRVDNPFSTIVDRFAIVDQGEAQNISLKIFI